MVAHPRPNTALRRPKVALLAFTFTCRIRLDAVQLPQPQLRGPFPNPFHPNMKSIQLLPLAALLAACQSTPTNEWRTTLALNTTVADEYEAEVSAGGIVADGDVDYDSLGIELGATNVDVQAGRDLKHESFLVGYSVGELDGSTDIRELYAGGKVYFDGGGTLIPFLGAYASLLDFEDGGDVDPQVGARLGGGVEVVLTDDFALSAGIDYLLPLISAEEGPVEADIEGWAIRVGLVVMF